MANINTYKAYEKMMQDPETRKSYIREKKRRRSASKRKKMPANDPTKLPAGLKKDTTTSAYGDGGRGRPVPEFNQGGMCRGAGAAIKGTNFKGVF
jgi:hypothetical protein